MCAIHPAADRAAPDMVVKSVVPLLISCPDNLSIIENRELSPSTILYIFLSISPFSSNICFVYLGTPVFMNAYLQLLHV